MAWPVPPQARTTRWYGDAHFGLLSASRMQKLADMALRTDSPMVPKVAATVQIGDINDLPISGDTQDVNDTAALAWWTRFASPKAIVIGNHDLQGGRTKAGHEALYGSTSQNIDLGDFRVVTMDYNGGTAVQNAAEAMIAADNKPVILGVHFPPRDTVQAVGAPVSSLGSATPYTYALNAGPDTWLRSMVAAHNNLKMVVHGHVHAWKSSTGLVTTITSGSNTIASVNVMATSYLGTTSGDFAPPMYGFYLTMVNAAGTSWEIRVRSEGAGVWSMIDATSGRVKTVTVT